jgi:hypothetical protein
MSTRLVYTPFINPAFMILRLGEGMKEIDAIIHERKLELAKEIIDEAKRVAMLNALPLNAIQREVINIKCVRFTDILTLRDLAITLREKPLINYIRHESTVKLLSSILGVELKPSSDLYKYEWGDALVVVTLKRPIRGQEVEVKPEDLEYFVCKVS